MGPENWGRRQVFFQPPPPPPPFIVLFTKYKSTEGEVKFGLQLNIFYLLWRTKTSYYKENVLELSLWHHVVVYLSIMTAMYNAFDPLTYCVIF